MESSDHRPVLLKRNSSKTDDSGSEAHLRSIAAEVLKIRWRDNGESLPREHLPGVLLEIGAVDEVYHWLVQVPGPEEVRATDPRKVLPRGIPLPSGSLCGSCAVMGTDAEGVSSPTDCAEAIIWEVRNLEVIGEGTCDVKTSLPNRPGFVVPRDTKEHLVLERSDDLHGSVALFEGDYSLTEYSGRTEDGILNEVSAVPTENIRFLL